MRKRRGDVYFFVGKCLVKIFKRKVGLQAAIKSSCSLRIAVKQQCREGIIHARKLFAIILILPKATSTNMKLSMRSNLQFSRL